MATSMWLCTDCMLLHAWSGSCRYAGDVLVGPFNGNNTDYLIYGTSCPPLPVESSSIDNYVCFVTFDHLPCPDLDFFNEVFLKQVPIVKNIPTKCKLQFSKVLKFTMDRVLDRPCDIASWVQLLILPVGVLHVYIPKNNREEKSGNRKKLQIASINHAILQWFETGGLYKVNSKGFAGLPNA